MSETHRGSLPTCPTAQQFAADARRRASQLAVWGVLLALATGGCLVTFLSSAVPVFVIAGSAFMIALWRRPKLGVFVLFGAALVIEMDASHFPRLALTGAPSPFFFLPAVPFFRPIQEVVNGSGVFLSAAELCMLVVALVCVLQAVYARRFSFQGGKFLPAFMVLFAWWIFEAVYGMATGGAAKIAFQEIRLPAYAIILYLLTYNLVTRRSDLETLGWMILIGTGLRGFHCLYLYFFTFHGDISWSSTGASLLEHHDSFFINAFIFYTILLFVTNGPIRQKRLALLLLPAVLIANVLNGRRASTGASVFALLALLPVLYAAFEERRVSLVRLVAGGAVFMTLYAGLFWNSQGTFAQPIRAIRSQFTPDARDASSDAYRKTENRNILYTIRTSPILGYGFGKEFLRPFPMLDFRNVDPYLFVLPHNSVLWVWMRLGTLGFLLFWFMNAQWIARACRTACRYREDWIRRWSIFAVAIVVINLVIGYLDMGLYGPRINIYLGVVLGVLDRLPSMANTMNGDGAYLAR